MYYYKFSLLKDIYSLKKTTLTDSVNGLHITMYRRTGKNKAPVIAVVDGVIITSGRGAGRRSRPHSQNVFLGFPI